jgi:hypothetical protein
VRDGDDGAGERREELLEPRDGLRVEVVRRLVQEENVRLREKEAADRDASSLAPG